MARFVEILAASVSQGFLCCMFSYFSLSQGDSINLTFEAIWKFHIATSINQLVHHERNNVFIDFSTYYPKSSGNTRYNFTFFRGV